MVRAIVEVFAAIYVRVSTLDQMEHGWSIETQIEVLQRYAEAEGRVVPEKHIYVDVMSGVSTLRPGFEALIAAMESGEVDTVYIIDPDRLGRGAFEVLSLCNRILEAGAVVNFMHGPSGDSEESQLLMMIMGWAAGQERLKIAERTMRGKRAVALSGRMPIGVGGKGILGYDYDSVLKIRTINEAEAAVVRMIFEWYVARWTSYAIAKELNEKNVPTKRDGLWHPRTVEYILRHTSYIGWDVFGKYRCRIVYVNRGTRDEERKIERTLRPESEWIWIEGWSPVIVDRCVWDQAQRLLDMPRPKKMGPEVYVLTGTARCSKCGTRINGASRKGDVRKYRCRGTAATSKRGKICNARYIEAEPFEEAVFGGLAAALRNPEVVLAELDQFLDSGTGDVAPQIAELSKKIRQCRDRESRLMSLYGDKDIDQDALKLQIGPTKLLREEYERTLGELERQRELVRDSDRIKALVVQRCHELAEGIEDLDFDGKLALLGALDVQVFAVTGEVSITMTVTEKRTTIGRTWA